MMGPKDAYDLVSAIKDAVLSCPWSSTPTAPPVWRL